MSRVARANRLLPCVVVTVVLSLEATPGAPPALGELRFLPGDAAVVAAMGDQSAPEIARGGDRLLAVWSDSRADEGKWDIYGILLDDAGSPIGTSFAINTDDGSQTRPVVAWNGESWLVAFQSEGRLSATRVDEEGTVLDSPAIAIAEPGTTSGILVASDGLKWAVLWAGTSAGNADLRGARIGPGGEILDPGGVVILPETYYVHRLDSLAYSSDRYLLVWGSDAGISGLHLSRTLRKLDSQPITIAGGAYFENSPAVSGNGSEFYLVWTETDNSYWVNQIKGSRVPLAGPALIPAGVPINENVSGGAGADVDWDGTRWIVAWTGAGAFANRVSASGSVLDGTGIQLASSTAFFDARDVAVAGAPVGGAKVVWQDYRNRIENDIWGASARADGTAGPDAVVGISSPSQQNPRVVWNGTGYTVVFLSRSSSTARILVQRLDASGVAIDAEPIEVATGTDLTDPGIAWSGQRYLVTWRTRSNLEVYSRRLAPDLSFQDAVPTFVMTGDEPAVAALGDTFLVAVQNSPSYWQWRDTYAQRIDGVTGARLGNLIGLPGGFAWGGTVGTIGNRWLVAWEAHWSHNQSPFTLVGAWIEANGTAGSSFGMTPGSGFGGAGVEIASHPERGAIVHSTGYPSPTSGEINLMRVQADGTFLDGYTGLAVSGNGPGRQFAPAAAWNGVEFVTAFQDDRASTPYVSHPKSDIYASRVTAEGIVLDEIGGFPVETTPAPEYQPALAGSGGRTLLAASHLRGAPFSALRIGTRMLIAEGVAGLGPVRDLLFDDPAAMHWSDDVGAPASFDLLRGDLAALQQNASIGDASCLDDDQPAAAYLDSDVPAPGSGFYYVVRADAPGIVPGTYDAPAAIAQVHGRDDDVATQGGIACNPVP